MGFKNSKKKQNINDEVVAGSVEMLIRKSKLTATCEFDYQKLCKNCVGLLECKIERKGEYLNFIYDKISIGPFVFLFIGLLSLIYFSIKIYQNKNIAIAIPNIFHSNVIIFLISSTLQIIDVLIDAKIIIVIKNNNRRLGQWQSIQ